MAESSSKTASDGQEHDERFRQILQLAKVPDSVSYPHTNVTSLNLTGAGLSELPSGFEHAFPNLSVLFLSQCRFVEMPAVIGRCPKLQMVAFKDNNMKSIHPDALQPQLRWLILTNNDIGDILPDTIGRCERLQKLMLSGNKLTKLTSNDNEYISKLQNLELIRLASNKLAEPPTALLNLPNLRWVALSDNPFLTDHVHKASNNFTLDSLPVLDIPDNDVQAGEILGTGAGGTTRKVLYNDTYVAVKEYRQATENGIVMTSDGLPAEERRINCAASSLHASGLIKVLGTTGKNESLVMEYLHDFTALAGPPSMDSCSRDVYSDDLVLTPDQAEVMVDKLLQAVVKLHEIGICHGDFYAHNILVSRHDPTDIRLSDFGAAFFYDNKDDAQYKYGMSVERVELQAFITLVEELLNITKRQTSSNVLQSFLDKLSESSCSTFANAAVAWQQVQLAKMAKAFDVED